MTLFEGAKWSARSVAGRVAAAAFAAASAPAV